MSDKSFDEEEFEKLEKRCSHFGLAILKPHGLRKYYYLQEGFNRYRLGRTWEEAKTGVGRGVRWLFENPHVFRIQEGDPEVAWKSSILGQDQGVS